MLSHPAPIIDDPLQQFCEELASILIEQALWEQDKTRQIDGEKCYGGGKGGKHGNSRNLR